ncbi:MAG: hypothetical protein HJJLKODD_02917 [Phycisphaerae bacterium]|nr:hypothetical protein [Phycisphaerae bacterium]
MADIQANAYTLLKTIYELQFTGRPNAEGSSGLIRFSPVPLPAIVAELPSNIDRELAVDWLTSAGMIETVNEPSLCHCRYLRPDGKTVAVEVHRGGLESIYRSSVDGQVMIELSTRRWRGPTEKHGFDVLNLCYRLTARGIEAIEKTAEDRAESEQGSYSYRELRIVRDITGDIAILDGLELPLSSNYAADFLTRLQKQPGKFVKAKILDKVCGSRSDRIYKTLPAEIQKLIDKPERGHSGYRLHSPIILAA